MTPGTILFDDKFVFKDGEKGRKLFIVLNEGTDGRYIAVKTTSIGGRYSTVFGCQCAQRYPCFFLPKHSTCLKEDTWVQLDAFFSFDKASLVQKVITNVIKRIGSLTPALSMDMIQCASQSDDISEEDRDLILMDCKSLSDGSTQNPVPTGRVKTPSSN